jgi:hypothetical protein
MKRNLCIFIVFFLLYLTSSSELIISHKVTATNNLNLPALSVVMNQSNTVTLAAWFMVRDVRDDLELFSFNNFKMRISDYGDLVCDLALGSKSATGLSVEFFRWNFALCTVSPAKAVSIYLNKENPVIFTSSSTSYLDMVSSF